MNTIIATVSLAFALAGVGTNSQAPTAAVCCTTECCCECTDACKDDNCATCCAECEECGEACTGCCDCC